MRAARAGLARFERNFSQELGDCRSAEQFEGLIEDLELFHSDLGVDVQRLIERASEAKAELEDNKSERADHMYDEWKERRYVERDGERSVSDMFSSSRGDRD